jgi:hypothetical protein
MDHLDRIHAEGDASGIESGQDGGEVNDGEGGEQYGDRPMELKGPTEGLLIDHEDKDEREQDAEDEADDVGEKTEQTRFK